MNTSETCRSSPEDGDIEIVTWRGCDRSPDADGGTGTTGSTGYAEASSNNGINQDGYGSGVVAGGFAIFEAFVRLCSNDCSCRPCRA